MPASNGRRWVAQLLGHLLQAGPEAYRTFQHRQDGMVKTLLQPELG